jgi:mannose-6-phosphate isomerase-like protein (cupin superfamily)
MYIAEGELVLVVAGEDYVLSQGQCVVWPSSHPHTMRNDSTAPAVAVGFTTETVY